ncbi:alpha/beta hydrolase [Paraliobacillus quinghaiensis]|uniref:Alpha/beta hydrolase n=1 Tax=Paraliobacillus quinghaiensis TaxID=470815 RepID=A0A917TSG1_9BACI|nr:alpha/beta hydrolase [Paraliobacillus quinghaiensis]GGM36107.1 alpha/beta hydrolase [Paraliobacillus quinghaiensis]
MKHADWIEIDDKNSIYFQKWEHPSNEQKKAVLQISHGMAEHVDRYDEFANFLMDHGFIVYGNDHRGHGQTGKKHGVGYFDEVNGFEKATNDLLTVTEEIKKQHPTLPIFLFGHSMGSFLVRNYLTKQSDYLSGVILSGTGSEPQALTKTVKLLAKWQISIKGWDQPSSFFNKLVFGNYARQFKHRQTDFDWLSRDQNNVYDYINDPDTGFIPSTSFFYDLFDGIETMQDPKKIDKIKKDLPFLFISGTDDPVGKYTNGVKKAIEQYKNQGIKNIDYKFYQGARHELLNEINKNEVMEDILSWLKRHLNS